MKKERCFAEDVLIPSEKKPKQKTLDEIEKEKQPLQIVAAILASLEPAQNGIVIPDLDKCENPTR